MHIYFAGIGGVAMGPLAIIAMQAGHHVAGYDMAASAITDELAKKGVDICIGDPAQHISGVHRAKPLDWIVMSSAITADNPVVAFAGQQNIKLTKRHELINRIICHDKKQRIIGVSGTHGKSTTTAMLIWLFKQFDVPASYSVGTLLGFGPSGAYSESAEYFVYEADEYDRNMLHFTPAYAVIPSVDYDHPDTYPTVQDYQQAFRDFIAQSGQTYLWQQDADYLDLKAGKKIRLCDDLLDHIDSLTLPGQHTRLNALLAAACFTALYPEFKLDQVIAALNRFPGTWRRFEQLADNLYTTYAHHPSEIAANIQAARELSQKVVAVYQPHQNIRQHSLADQYKNCFNGALRVYWLPTYLTREDPKLSTLTPQGLIEGLSDPSIATPAAMDDALIDTIRRELFKGSLVVCMSAGDFDGWLRNNLAKITDSPV